jgi:hypothetical protein
MLEWKPPRKPGVYRYRVSKGSDSIVTSVDLWHSLFIRLIVAKQIQ